MLFKSGLAITTTVDAKHFTDTFTVINDRETIFYHTFVRPDCILGYAVLPVAGNRQTGLIGIRISYNKCHV